MKKLIMILCVTILGGIGWAFGKHAGMVTAWLLSGLGAIVGVYLGWRIGRAYLD